MKLKSNEPFWLVKNGILHSYPSVRKNISAEILVIGGGITGSLIVHQCVKDGYHTALIDRREIANGSTSATTSMLQYEIDVPLYKLIEKIGEKGARDSYWACYRSIDALSAISKHIRSGCGFKKKDSLYIAAYKKDVAGLKREFEARTEAGIPVKWLNAEEIKARVHLEHAFGGILSHQGGSIDAFRLTHDLLAYNHKRGLEIFDKTELIKTEYKRTGVTVTTEDGYIVKAKKVIYCNGFESVQIIKEKFVKLLSTYAIVGERNEDDQSYLNDILIWDTADPYHYLRTTDDNRLLIGGEDEEFVNTAKRDALLSHKQRKLSKHLSSLLPGYDFKADFVWAGTFGETEDGLPYIGRHPDFPSSYFVLGFGGNGITFSVIGMEMISAMLRSKRHPLESHFKFGR